jgi:hypothetical protein
MLDTQGPPFVTERKPTRRQRDALFMLVVLAIGDVTVFALARGGDAFTQQGSPVAGRPSPSASSTSRA